MNLDALLPTDLAARLVYRSHTTIWQWTKRGHLQPAACDTTTRRHLYRVGDLLDTERATRRRSQRAAAQRAGVT